jgi:SAM-dependent methyltransferase
MIFALTAFWGAFLLFQVQPLIGKFILPWFGGGPEVWTTCMLFFQVLLLAGYAYAHLLTGRLGFRWQAVVHIVLVLAAVAALPITPRAGWRPESPDYPVLRIMLLAAACVGLPYFLLSATAPLVQRWFSTANAGSSPYWLYVCSNGGSLIALLSYPFVMEPAFTRQQQALFWSVGLMVFAILVIYCAVRLRTYPASGGLGSVGENATDNDYMPALGGRLLWLALPGAASVELLAVTNKICQDVAVIPFLWVVPLSLYLLSFIICFQGEKWYRRRLFVGLFILSIGGAALAWVYEARLSVVQQIAVYLVLLMACCMVCHGELFRLRPGPRRLTGYYLMIALGGAAGGVFVAVVAPVIFNTYRELHVGILASCLFALLADEKLAAGRRRLLWVGVILIAGIASVFVQSRPSDKYETAVLNYRNFFGVLTVWERDRDYPEHHRFVLQHGTTCHGFQFVDPEKHLLPTTYYGPESGVGLAVDYFGRRRNMRIGVVGLGVGTIAAYAGRNDYVRFYEINPEVERIARTRFSYLAECPAKVDVSLGDARLSMEVEAPQNFDILVLDAFNGDAVPVHLLTEEAFEIYLRHLKPDGVIAVHVSSQHLDLPLVVWKAAEHFRMQAVLIEDPDNDEMGIMASDWVLLTNNEQFLAQNAVRQASSEPGVDFDDIRLWTDDYVNLFQILK